MTAYPPAPWHMHGSLWLSAFRIADDVDAMLTAAAADGIRFERFYTTSPASSPSRATLPEDKPKTLPLSSGRPAWKKSPRLQVGRRGSMHRRPDLLPCYCRSG